tara:strand:- start:1048 stop:1755 length:708 start_codon:yes stop_codon:yes gene_type:complete
MSQPTILLIDDDVEVHQLLRTAINPLVHMDTAQNLKQALTHLRSNHYHLVLVDLNINDENGLDFIRDYSTSGLLNLDHIIILTGSDAINDEVESHGLGVRDYLKKPLNLKVLRAVLDKHLEQVLKFRPNIIVSGPITLDVYMHKATLLESDGSISQLDLTDKEFLILKMLIDSPERIFNRETIFEKLWDQDSDSLSRTVDVHISSLRKKLGALSECIQNKRGQGYFYKQLALKPV